MVIVGSGMENQATKAEFRAKLLELAKEVSTSPGVYIMKDTGGLPLYVGKAKNLKNRLVTYFQIGPHESPRTEMMVLNVEKFEVILTETEPEALILECNLIKKFKPKFNVRLKDDKAYPYLKIAVGEAFPRIEWTRRAPKDGARYFGPFPSAGAARQVMQLLNETLRLRDCSDNTFRHRSRPCILFQMDRCTAPCVGRISAADYRDSIQQAVSILEGHGEKFIQSLRKGMEDAASREEFEEAAFYRDQLRNLEVVTSTQVVDEAGTERNRDVIGIARKGADAHGAILQIRKGLLESVRHYHLQNTDPTLPDHELLFEFLAQHYLALTKKEGDEASIPKDVLLPSVPDDPDLLERMMGFSIRVPETPSEEQLIQVARVNAESALEQNLKKVAGHSARALEEVQRKLHLQKLPQRIECFDISNNHGQDAVASQVVFIDGAPDKNLYRRYKIKTVEGSNDFAMMKEVLGRRFSHKDEPLPDLVVVDGGKGQLSQATSILEELSVQGVGVVGLAKARVKRDFKSAEVESSMERIFIPNRKNPVSLLPHTEAYKLLTHVRDEAHRFAIAYHRQLRSKTLLQK